MRPFDEEAVGRAKAGDQTAFERVLRPLIHAAYRFACVMLRDSGEAEDVIQEAALKAWRHLDQLQHGLDPRPWFLGIVANECRSLRRGRWWSTIKVAETPGHVEAADDDVAQYEDLRAAILRLNPRQRAVLTLFYYLDLPLEEVAAVTNQSVPATRSQLYRALQRIRPGLDVPEDLQ